MLQDIWKWLEQTMNQFKGFILDHKDNPLLWLAFFCIGLAVFSYTYNTLNKNK